MNQSKLSVNELGGLAESAQVVQSVGSVGVRPAVHSSNRARSVGLVELDVSSYVDQVYGVGESAQAARVGQFSWFGQVERSSGLRRVGSGRVGRGGLVERVGLFASVTSD